jgi:hypothetical protein
MVVYLAFFVEHQCLLGGLRPNPLVDDHLTAREVSLGLTTLYESLLRLGEVRTESYVFHERGRGCY